MGLAQEHVEDDLVDLVVGAVEQHRLDLGARLAEAVDPALPLFEAVGVPGQVVVHDRVEMLLEVDALRQAVGRDQNPPFVGDELLDPLAPLLVPDLAGNRPHLETVEGLAEQLRQPGRQVVGSRDEPAENDRPVAVPQQRGERPGQPLQLAVGLGALERARPPHEAGQPPTLGTGPGGFGVLERRHRHVVARLLVIQRVSDLRAIGAVLLVRARVRRDAHLRRGVAPCR